MSIVKPVTPSAPVAKLHGTPVMTGGVPGSIEQIQPARSVAALARGAMSAGTDSVTIAFNVRARGMLQGEPRPGHMHSGRRLLATLRSSFGSADNGNVASLADELAMLGDHDELHARIGSTGLNPGMQAMLVSALAERAFAGSGRRKLLEKWLDELLAAESWQLELLGSLEFGPDNAALTQLRSLYQSAAQSGKPLAAWFKELRDLPERRRKLRVLIRALGLSLSSEGAAINGEHLADVITDLKRLLIFLGMDEQCVRLARNAPEPQPSGDDVLALLLGTIDSGWAFEGGLRGDFARLGLAPAMQPRFAYRYKRLIEALPAPVFRDEHQLEQICEALQPIIDDTDGEEAE